jgi:PAS domain S-box-containing protein
MPVTDGNGKLVLFDGVFVDITEHKEMEEKLQKSEEFSSKLLNNSPNPIAVIDSDGLIKYVNPALEKITGYSAAELLGTKLPYPWFTEETCGAGGMNLHVAMHKRVDGEEKLFGKKGGEQFWVEESTVPIVYSDGSEYLLVNWVDITEQKRLRENMQFYIREITMAQEQERKRLSRELHDETVQSLADLYTDIDEIMMKERLSANVIQRLQQLRHKVDDMLDEVHRFSHELQPGLLDEFGLIPSLELLTEEMNTGEKFNCRINTMGSERRLPFEAETILFRITQEALRNIKKHSGATEGVINVEFCDGRVRISITDNGIGFEIPDDLSSFARRRKLGIMGMQERARLVNGSLSIKSKANKGTTITVEMPA